MREKCARSLIFPMWKPRRKIIPELRFELRPKKGESRKQKSGRQIQIIPSYGRLPKPMVNHSTSLATAYCSNVETTDDWLGERWVVNPTIYFWKKQSQFLRFTRPHSSPNHPYHITPRPPASVPPCGQLYRIWKDAATSNIKLIKSSIWYYRV